jgi:hypothetical protein
MKLLEMKSHTLRLIRIYKHAARVAVPGGSSYYACKCWLAGLTNDSQNCLGSNPLIILYYITAYNIIPHRIKAQRTIKCYKIRHHTVIMPRIQQLWAMRTYRLITQKGIEQYFIRISNLLLSRHGLTHYINVTWKEIRPSKLCCGSIW